MHLQDGIYGEHFVDEPVISALINSRPLQRLRGITQYGLPKVFYPVEGFSRFEHSIGVMLLVRSLKGTLTQQVAGLIHDVSHTAFSHVTDSILGESASHNAQDARHLDFVLKSEIPGIISPHGLSAENVADLERQPLVDRETPDLCADRIDYSLREFSFFMEEGKLRKLADDLITYQGKIIFSSYESAEIFGVNYSTCHLSKWASPEKTVRQHLFAELLKAAISEKVILVSDLFKDDQHVMDLLMASKNDKIHAGIKLLSSELMISEENKEPHLSLPRRYRSVDPEFIEKGRVFRLSRISSTYREILQSQWDLHRKPLSVTVAPVQRK